ncbi:hypothetical protein [Burkholderia thailandensis]|uniref:hypothetical protein n=2 Tax=Burkholderia thailandensis TaxID=57975 RepID=UPI000FD655FF|nr:hypothetical protein [Burkholderia thailandensis]
MRQLIDASMAHFTQASKGSAPNGQHGVACLMALRDFVSDATTRSGEERHFDASHISATGAIEFLNS